MQNWKLAANGEKPFRLEPLKYKPIINPRVKTVSVLPNYRLLLRFTNNEEKIFYMAPYLNKGVFTALQNEALFKKAHINWGTVVWNDDLDMSPDTLYLESKAPNNLLPQNAVN